eukprot:TRINITY_DN55799_c0_g1_i1.p1 TRINITY_DN55799_c0_g1~~TRINITY_DN55799_c0_g1_i1.p1  ORF type:complete len:341 (-),score=25.36 TRINITY_DN55799_c0_g1_i1:44-1066(-)
MSAGAGGGAKAAAPSDASPERAETGFGASRSQPILTRVLSHQTKLDLTDVPEFSNEPGPGHYYNPASKCFSSLGKQKNSKNPSAPGGGFSHTGWNQWEKVVISKGHEGARLCRDSPGFEYHPGQVGASSKRVGPSTFGASVRPDIQEGLGKDSPGPTCNLREGRVLGARAAGSQSAGPGDRKGFGTSERFSKDRVGALGPGQHNCASLLDGGSGKSFGASRNVYDKVLRPNADSTDYKCRTSPGIGPMLRCEVTKGASPVCTIGRAERFAKDRGGSEPGPGYYRQDERSVGLSTSRRSGSASGDTRRPGATVFGKREPKKPRFRIHLAHTTSSRGGWGYF